MLKDHVRNALVLLMSCSFFQLANSASFDCSQAQGFVESTICSDPELSELDTILSREYKKKLTETEKPNSFQKNQRDWLAKERSACTTSACLVTAYKKRIAEIGLSQKVQWKTYQDKKLGVQFLYASNRDVELVKPDSLRLVEPEMNGSDYIIEFEIGTGNFEKAIQDSAIFEKREGTWIAAIGPSENSPAEKIKGNNWRGIKSVITYGVSDKEPGFHAAGGECLWAVLSNDKHYIVANTQGILGNDDLTLKTLMSIKFLD
jgi:uncharacterized protein